MEDRHKGELAALREPLAGTNVAGSVVPECESNRSQKDALRTTRIPPVGHRHLKTVLDEGVMALQESSP